MDTNDGQYGSANDAPARKVPVVVFIRMTQCDQKPRLGEDSPVLPGVDEQEAAMDRGPGISYC